MLIIFDFDGVLLSASWPGLFEAYKAIIKAAGKDHHDFFKDIQEFKKWWSPDWRKNNNKMGITDLEFAHDLFYKTYHFYAALFPWVAQVLGGLSIKNRLAILTNRHCETTRDCLGSFLSGYFFLMVGGGDVKKLKPDPEGLNMILKISGVPKEETLLIGDMPEDIFAGKAAGVKTGAVRWGLGEWKKLLAASPYYEFLTYKDLLRL